MARVELIGERGGRGYPCKKPAAHARVYIYTYHSLEGFISIQHCFAGTVTHFAHSRPGLTQVFVYLAADSVGKTVQVIECSEGNGPVPEVYEPCY